MAKPAGLSALVPASGSWFDKFIPTATALVTVLAAYTTYTVNKFEGALKQQQQISQDRERLVKEYFEVYDLVVKSLESQDAQRQEAARAMIAAVIQENDLKVRLMSVLGSGAQPAVRRQANEDIFNLQQSEAVAQAGSGSGWQSLNWDVFWCESSGARAQLLAQRIVGTMKDQGASGRVRVRVLPVRVNQQRGYEASGYEIRPEASESGAADALLKVLAAAGLDLSWRTRQSSMSTPGYLSLFVCPAPE